MATVCAFAVVFDERSRVLLCKRRKDGKWNLPGGHADDGESPWRAALREFREETGSDARIERLAAVDWLAEPSELVLTFACSLVSEVGAPSEEIERIDWFDTAQLPKPMRERHADRIDAVLRTRASVVLAER